jgi:hypothetical protein
MHSVKILFILSQVLADLGLISGLLLPDSVIPVMAKLGAPMRWFVPLVLFTLAGLGSAVALGLIYWVLSRLPGSASAPAICMLVRLGPQ